MIIVAIILAVSLAAVAGLGLQALAMAENRAAAERSQLLDRIQHPERPIVSAAEFVFPEVDADADQLDLIGTIAEPPETSQ